MKSRIIRVLAALLALSLLAASCGARTAAGGPHVTPLAYG